jgi:hypothetical protein
VVRRLAFAGAAALSGCAAEPQPRDASAAAREERADELDFRCARAVMPQNSVYRMPLAGKETDPSLAARLAAVPYRARRTALAAGLEPLLSRLLEARAASPAASAAELAQEEELALRLGAFESQVTAAAFEAGCTARSLQKLLARFAQREQSRQVSLAVTSLLVGGIAGTVSGVWGLADDSSHAPLVIAIAGGIATTALGAVALTHVDKPLFLAHARNRLAPIWNGADPDHLYPSFVFHMLVYEDTSGSRPPREELLGEWQARIAELAPAAPAALERLLFGEGGVYSDAMLALRAEMFEGIETAIQGTAREVELLDRSLVRELGTPLGSGAPDSPPRVH